MNKLLASFITAIALAFLGIASEIQAAEISCPGDPEDNLATVKKVAETVGLPDPNKFVCNSILLKGTIVAGDFDVFESMLREGEPHVDSMALWSDGGDVAESLKIGNLIRKRMLKTRAPGSIDGQNGLYINGKFVCKDSDCYCASACFFIWAAGIARWGNAIVVHRPRDVSGALGRKPAAAASSEYTAVLGVVSDYLSQKDVPSTIMAYMNTISSNKASYIPYEQIKTYLNGYVPSVHEWLIADCGAMTEQEDYDELRLSLKSMLNLSEEAYFRLLDGKKRTIS